MLIDDSTNSYFSYKLRLTSTPNPIFVFIYVVTRILIYVLKDIESKRTINLTFQLTQKRNCSVVLKFCDFSG